MAWQQAVGEAVGAVAGGVGGYFGQKAAGKDARKMARWNAAENERVLRNQIQWRVEDATKAGLHPLAALGVNPASGPQGQVVGDSGWMERTGQNIGRAVEAAMTPEDKAAGAFVQLQAERGQLENELLRTQIASERMRNMQMGTPGSPNPSVNKELGGVAQVPGLPGGWEITNAKLGQQLEDAYSEWANVLTGAAFFNDAIKYLKLERLLAGIPTPLALGEKAGKQVNEWFLQDAKGNVYK